MADKRISEFLDGGLVQTGDEIAAVRGGDNYKVRVGSAAAYDAGQSGGELVVLEEDSSGTVMLPAVSGEQLTDLPFAPDPTVAVSADDVDPGYLEDKITGSASITVTKETDSAGVESLRLDVAGAGGVVEIADGGTGATNAADAQINLGIVPSRDIQGGIISNGTTDAEHDIDVTALTCLDSTFTTVMSVGAITKALDSTFAEGTGNGGMASGEALPTSGTIHIWAITKADGTGDVFANNHASSGLSPALPSGFENIRYLWSLITDSSANIEQGLMIKNYWRRDEGASVFGVADVFVTTLSTTATPFSVSSPEIDALVDFEGYINSTVNTAIGIGATDQISSFRFLTTFTTDTSTSTSFASVLLSEPTIYLIRANSDVTVTLQVRTRGWWNLSRGVL